MGKILIIIICPYLLSIVALFTAYPADDNKEKDVDEDDDSNQQITIYFPNSACD